MSSSLSLRVRSMASCAERPRVDNGVEREAVVLAEGRACAAGEFELMSTYIGVEADWPLAEVEAEAGGRAEAGGGDGESSRVTTSAPAGMPLLGGGKPLELVSCSCLVTTPVVGAGDSALGALWPSAKLPLAAVGIAFDDDVTLPSRVRQLPSGSTSTASSSSGTRLSMSSK